mmetsp:Transcript_33084/g.53757  ORF Transcript_33084/g.53757 Transcript_33084/m.53757 type:complete len:1018 (+) Transcript_33084:95-3148(+)
MKRVLLSVLVSILWFTWKCESQSCDQWSAAAQCESGSAGACAWLNGACRCASEIELDILFGIDTSGSIQLSGFRIERDFLSKLVTQGIADGARIGFTMFNTQINESRPIDFWDSAELLNYVNGLYWTAGYTNTPELIETALAEFTRSFDPSRQQIFMILTDGNPCLPGDCPLSVCEYAESVKRSGIRTIIVGVGDGLNSQYVSCLLQKDSDFIPVASFTPSDFDQVVGSLSEVLCPINKEMKFTEIKAQKKSDITTGVNGRWSRFVEIYNNGIDFNTNDIQLSGLVTMAHGAGPDQTVTQGQYLVFYDASDPPFSSDSFTQVSPSCHLCDDSQCTLSSCTGSQVSTWSGSCFCTNSVYVACANSQDGVAACNTHVNSVSLSASGSQLAPLNGCSVCEFQDSTKTGWTVAVGDTGNTAIDTVTHGAEGYWITTDDGFSYELVSAGYDNSIGDNWAQSCSVLGTPGAPPSASCSAQCSATSCGAGGSCNAATGLCECDPTTGYYPQCTDPQSCTKCLLVPQSEVCTVYWSKNGTDTFAVYEWSDNNRDGTTEYEITYLSTESGVAEKVTATTQGALSVRVDNYAPSNTTYGGFVRSVLDVCQGTGANEVCNVFYSTATECEVVTSTPTTSPTPAPTSPPTPAPSNPPTPSPTLQCPLYFWNQEDVCERCASTNANCQYGGYRCQCTDSTNDYCCLSAQEGVQYDADRAHKTSDGCKLDVQWEEPRGRNEDDWESDPTPGYLLSEGDHSFQVDFMPDDYPCTMDIFWALVFENVDCSYTSRRRLQSNNSNAGGNGNVACDSSSNDISQAGLAVDVQSGMLTVFGADDVINATVDFTVERLQCADGGKDCYDSLAVYGELIIVNATSRCDPSCYDGRIYPMRIPVWYNYAAALLVVPSSEETLPAWLWWLIGALAIFLAILAILVYKYWWKNKATGAALASKQADLDDAIAEQEMGWAGGLAPNAVGFNPLATGFNPNAPAGAANPNGPPDANPVGKEFVRPLDERPIFKVEYGQKYGNMG